MPLCAETGTSQPPTQRGAFRRSRFSVIAIAHEICAPNSPGEPLHALPLPGTLAKGPTRSSVGNTLTANHAGATPGHVSIHAYKLCAKTVLSEGERTGYKGFISWVIIGHGEDAAKRVPQTSPQPRCRRPPCFRAVLTTFGTAPTKLGLRGVFSTRMRDTARRAPLILLDGEASRRRREGSRTDEPA